MTLPENDTASRNTHEHRLRVTYRDSDQMGFVYYANYFVYMETGRTELLRAKGWSYREMEQSGYLLPVLHASCDYKRPARYDDLILVRTTMETLTRARLEFAYELVVEDRHVVVATGRTVHSFMSPDGRLVRAPQDILERLK